MEPPSALLLPAAPSASSNPRRRPAAAHSALSLLASFILGFLAATAATLSTPSTAGRRTLRNGGEEVDDGGGGVDSVGSVDGVVPAASQPWAGTNASAVVVATPPRGPALDEEEEDGWKPIHVFYGTREHLEGVTTHPRKAFREDTFFSQVGQDEIVTKMFREKRGGYFVDLAANEAVHISNTYALEARYNWDGLCVEPNARYWPSLSYRRCHVVGAVAGRDREEVQFTFQDALGGIVGNQYDNKKATQRAGTSASQPRLTVTLDEVLRRFRAPEAIDYLSLDVEGAEGVVLTQSVLSRYTFKVMSLERPKKELVELLARNGYTKLAILSRFEETLWGHESALPELDLSDPRITVHPTF